MSLKAVFFDFGGTIDLYPEIREDALSAAAEMLFILDDAGLNISEEYSVTEFYELMIHRLSKYKAWKKASLVELPSERVWKDYILFDNPGKDLIDLETAEKLTFLLETGRYTRQVRPEMKDVMDEMVKTGLGLGIISNVLSLTQVPRNLVDYGLEEYFSTVVLSSEFGRVKPDPSIFHYASDSIGYLPGECIYVGNSPSKDIQGAKNAGYMAAIQIEYVDDSDDTLDPGVAPDHYIRSMRELPKIIRSYM